MIDRECEYQAREALKLWRYGAVMNSMNPSISTAPTKSKEPASKKKKTVARAAKLKSSKWYQGAARSIGITKESARKSQ
jgi:hypothetical protein